MNIFLGIKKLEEVVSPVNGKVEVIKGIAFGTYIQVEGLTQSGGVVYDVWNTTLKKVKKQKSDIKSCLVLGLGGGSVVKLVNKYWSDVQITGVDIDPIMVEMGKKHLGFDAENIQIIIKDAKEFIRSAQKDKKKLDLILVDMYVGTNVPEKFENDKFIRDLKELLNGGGVIVFNRLYYGEKRKEARKFLDKLEKEFIDVNAVYPEANVMYVCS